MCSRPDHIISNLQAMASIEDLVRRAEKAERQVEELFHEVNSLQAASGPDASQDVPEELAKLRVENVKLNYRLGILQRATGDN